MTAKTARAYILRQNDLPSSSSSGVSSSDIMHLLASPLRRLTTFQNSSSETVLSYIFHLQTFTHGGMPARHFNFQRAGAWLPELTAPRSITRGIDVLSCASRPDARAAPVSPRQKLLIRAGRALHLGKQ